MCDFDLKQVLFYAFCFRFVDLLRNFVAVHLNKLIKKGGGTGPMKPWQPHFLSKGAKSAPALEKIS
ncbi:MAG: hypothetical protein RLZZ65_1315 [Bacteroidota bacterium]|jgi:hypothetical protein